MSQAQVMPVKGAAPVVTKPFYKKLWFWIVVILVLAGASYWIWFM